MSESKQKQINNGSWTTAQVASLFWGYIRGKTEHPDQLETYEARDFLPFQFQENDKKISKETAKIVIAAMESGQCPTKVIGAIVDCELYDEILKLGKQSDG